MMGIDERSLDEISPEEFYELESRLSAARGKTSPELLERLTKSGLSTQSVADFLGVSTEAAYSRLKNLQKKGYLEERYKGKKAYWLILPNGKLFLERLKREVVGSEVQ